MLYLQNKLEMKRKTFIDYLQDLFTDIADAVAEPANLVFDFLGTLPGFSLVEDVEVLPKGTLLKGCVLSSEKTFEFEFHGNPNKKEVDVILNNELLCSDSWAEATRELVDTISPGDRLMTFGSPHPAWNFFSYK